MHAQKILQRKKSTGGDFKDTLMGILAKHTQMRESNAGILGINEIQVIKESFYVKE